jgi:hypothetical protein
MKIKVLKIYLGILYANMLASLFTWSLLASFIIFLITFSRTLDNIRKAGKVVFGIIQNVPFL